MGISRYLALTRRELEAWAPPEGWAAGYLACHFAPYGPGLSELPGTLPPGSLLILTDRIPLRGHDPRQIARQLRRESEALGCGGILLDLEDPRAPGVRELCRELTRLLPEPPAVPAALARELDCPVFLPPCPPDLPLQAHLAPWQGRELWLELSWEPLALLLTQAGCRELSPEAEVPGEGHSCPELRCNYRIDRCPDGFRFTLWRDPAAQLALLDMGQSLGVTRGIGLYQELCRYFPESSGV